MKPILLAIILPIIGTASDMASLCPVSLTNETAVLYGSQPQYVRGPSGAVYKACWSGYAFPNSGTHTNISVQALEEIAPNLPMLGKSIAISGITDLPAFMAAMGMVRCDSEGNELSQGDLQ